MTRDLLRLAILRALERSGPGIFDMGEAMEVLLFPVVEAATHTMTTIRECDRLRDHARDHSWWNELDKALAELAERGKP